MLYVVPRNSTTQSSACAFFDKQQQAQPITHSFTRTTDTTVRPCTTDTIYHTNQKPTATAIGNHTRGTVIREVTTHKAAVCALFALAAAAATAAGA
jgi:hypothetical protein